MLKKNKDRIIKSMIEKKYMVPLMNTNYIF